MLEGLAMNRQRHRWGVVTLWTGVFALLGAGAAVAQQEPADVETPPEITIQQTPPGPLFADVDGYAVYVSERDVEPGQSSCDAKCLSEWIPVRASADATPFGEWSLVPRDDGAPQLGIHGATVVSMGEGNPTTLGGRAEPDVAVRSGVAIAGSGGQGRLRGLQARAPSARADFTAARPAGWHHGPSKRPRTGVRRWERLHAVHLHRVDAVYRAMPRDMEADAGAASRH